MCVLVIRSIPWVAGAQTERPAWGRDVGKRKQDTSPPHFLLALCPAANQSNSPGLGLLT